MCYETHDLFSSTKSQTYNKVKHNQVKLIISYKFAMESNTFLFEPDSLFCHSLVQQAQAVSMYVHVVAQ